MEHLGETLAEAFTQGRLNAEELTQVEAHLDGCAECAALIEGLLRLDASARSNVNVGASSGWRSAAAALRGSLETDALPEASAVGRYRILERLGAGGMGVVFAAYDPQLDRRVALKLLRPGAFAELGSDEARARWIREARALARLSHPNVVAVHDSGALGSTLFIAMELVDGCTLRQWWTAERRSPAQIVDVLCLAGRGLAAAHARGLVHRDFKPENVLIGRDGRVFVTDFGLARPVGGPSAPADAPAGAPEEAASVTRTGALLGTPGYMAPEQSARHPADFRTDQYAFCVTLHEALCGERPSETSALARAPGHVARALKRGLSPAPEDRFPSMDALLAALQPRARRRWPWAAAAAGLAALALGAGVVRQQRRAEASCQEGASLAGIWDEPTRAAAQAAFRATGRPAADAAWRSASGALERYAARLGEAQRTVCRAPHAPEQARQDSCLRWRRAELEALVRLYRAADGPVVDGAVQGALGLSAIDGCFRPDAPAQPQDEALRRDVAAVREQLANVKALTDTAQYPKALEAAREAAQRARALRFKALEAEALLRLGVVQALLAAPEGEATFVDTQLAAVESGQDALAARAWLYLADFQRIYKGDTAGLEHSVRQAAALLARVEGNPELHAMLEATRSSGFLLRGDFPKALEAAERALALRQTLSPADPLLVAKGHESVGGVLRRLGRDGEARAHEQQALDARISVLGEDHPLVATSLHRYAALENGTPQALELNQRALRIRERAFGPQHPDYAESCAIVGESLLQLGRVEEALPLMERALTLQRGFAPRHPRTATYATSLAGAYAQLSRFPEARRLLDEAIALLEGSGNQAGRVLGLSYTKLGDLSLEEGNPKAALAPYTRAEALFAQGPALNLEEARFGLARAQWALGRDRPAARASVARGREALLALEKTGVNVKRPLEQLDAWLKLHPAR